MNVFVTAMIVDALGPAVGATGLEENLERARRHLPRLRHHARRRHGPRLEDRRPGRGRAAGERPGSAEIVPNPGGTLPHLAGPQAEYVSIDPGEDPNPPDVGIQMHVLTFLARFDPTAARSLHQALRSAIGQDRIWVYYKRAPLVPLWRAADLHKLGYPVCVPRERLQTAPGQEIWVEACRLLASYVSEGAPRPAPAETWVLLETLAHDDFAAIRRNPPLLFHNDLTARCGRYYWSEDFGYALWLRLYPELVGSPPRRETSGSKS
jgi:hypothetical protein